MPAQKGTQRESTLTDAYLMDSRENRLHINIINIRLLSNLLLGLSSICANRPSQKINITVVSSVGDWAHVPLSLQRETSCNALFSYLSHVAFANSP